MQKTGLPSYLGHRKRVKEKYKISGLDGWLDYEILEYALSYAIPRRDAKPIAKDLLLRFNSIAAVLDAEIKDLETVKGISEHTALFLHLLKDVARIYLKSSLENKDLLSSPQRVAEYLLALLKGCKDELFYALFLNKSNYLIASELIQKGTVDRAVIYPRKIVERALFFNAANIIIAHNHPSGSIQPSKNDIELTKTIGNALETIDIAIHDHIIIGKNAYYSFKEHNLID